MHPFIKITKKDDQIMRKQETAKRYLLFVISLFFIGLGIAFAKHAGLGISPISSVANVMSMRFTKLTFGTWLFCTNCLFLLGQILLLRRKFQLLQLLQLPLSLLFGYFTDLGMWIVGALPNSHYGINLIWTIVGSAVIGFGVALGVIANVMLNSPEAFAKALGETVKKDFGNMKILMDVSWVCLAAVLSLLLFDGKLLGIREGTVIAAFLVGIFVKLFRPLLQEPLTKLLK